MKTSSSFGKLFKKKAKVQKKKNLNSVQFINKIGETTIDKRRQ